VSRVIGLPGALVPGNVTAIYEHNALTLHVPKEETTEQVTITVQVAAGL
jgi:HSP20 family molecular chaperone IbpA